MRVTFSSAEEFIQELAMDAHLVEEGIMRVTVRYQPIQDAPLVALSVVAGVVVNGKVIELRQQIGTCFWPPATEQDNTRSGLCASSSHCVNSITALGRTDLGLFCAGMALPSQLRRSGMSLRADQPPEHAPWTIQRYGRFWAVYDQDTLVVVTVYRRGALEVMKRLASQRSAQTAEEASHDRSHP